jgi:(S)-2-hydroxyglutarate dehydrogenase
MGGADLRLGTTVIQLGEGPSGVEVAVSDDSGEERLQVDQVVNCSGLFSDRFLTAAQRRDIRIIPFRGEYWTLLRPELVNGLVYPVPDPALPFLGIHLTRGWDGSVHIGPNAVLAFKQEGYRRTDFDAADVTRALQYPGLWRMAGTHLKNGIGEMSRSMIPALFLRRLRQMLPDVNAADVQHAPAGVRAQAVTRSGAPSDDFVIRRSPRIVHVVNAPSPAATACLQIGRYVAEQAVLT